MRRERRARVAVTTVTIAVAVVASACASGHVPRSAGATPTSLGAVPDRVRTPVPSSCGGLGAAEPAGAVTFVEGSRLMSVAPPAPARCLLDGIGPGTALRWNGPADKVILPDGRVKALAAAAEVAVGAGPSLTWSYPTGTAVLEVDPSGRLLRIPSAGGAPLDITFLAHHDAAVYHPAGTHVVSSGRGRDGTYGLWVATNRGSDVRLLARGETAISISNLVFTANHQLLFVADHGDHKDLHQLDLTTEALVTVATVRATDCFVSVVASRLPGGGVAWGTGPCAGGDVTATAVRQGAFLPLGGTTIAGATPVGFLPDGTLVGRSDHAIVTFRNGRPATIAIFEGGPAALRVIEPASPPIELPGIPGPERAAPV